MHMQEVLLVWKQAVTGHEIEQVKEAYINAILIR